MSPRVRIAGDFSSCIQLDVNFPTKAKLRNRISLDFLARMKNGTADKTGREMSGEGGLAAAPRAPESARRNGCPLGGGGRGHEERTKKRVAERTIAAPE
jgi:hypothetical protein